MTGLFAAVATPVHDDGRFDEAGFDRLVAFLVEAGVDGICIGGATGEYPHFETADRKAVIRRAAERLPRDRTLLVGIGSSSMRGSIELGETAVAAGSRALLLPMPMFFRYQQEDLQVFASHVSRALRAPSLLYDLPDFTNGLSPATVLALLRDEEFIVGIKDSSGQEQNLTTFADARRDRAWTLLVGDDRLLERRPAGGMGRRDFRRGRMLPRTAGLAGAKCSRRTPRRDGNASGPARRAHRPFERLSHALGYPDRARSARVSDRPAASAAHAGQAAATPRVSGLVSRVAGREARRVTGHRSRVGGEVQRALARSVNVRNLMIAAALLAVASGVHAFFPQTERERPFLTRSSFFPSSTGTTTARRWLNCLAATCSCAGSTARESARQMTWSCAARGCRKARLDGAHRS